MMSTTSGIGDRALGNPQILPHGNLDVVNEDEEEAASPRLINASLCERTQICWQNRVNSIRHCLKDFRCWRSLIPCVGAALALSVGSSSLAGTLPLARRAQAPGDKILATTNGLFGTLLIFSGIFNIAWVGKSIIDGRRARAIGQTPPPISNSAIRVGLVNICVSALCFYATLYLLERYPRV